MVKKETMRIQKGKKKIVSQNVTTTKVLRKETTQIRVVKKKVKRKMMVIRNKIMIMIQDHHPLLVH